MMESSDNTSIANTKRGIAKKQKHKPRGYAKQFDWPKLVSEWRTSGLTQSQFCKPLGITHQMFSANYAKLEKQQATVTQDIAGKFIAVKFNNPDVSRQQAGNNFTLEFPNGVKLNIPASPDGKTLRTIPSCFER